MGETYTKENSHCWLFYKFPFF